MSKERELLERAYYVLGELSYAILKDSGEYNLAGDIYEFLAEPRPEFVRLSEEEVTEILTSAYDMYAAICAVENRLVEKNRG